MKLLSLGLLIALAVFANAEKTKKTTKMMRTDEEIRFDERGRGDVTGLMRSGWERLKGTSREKDMFGQDERTQFDSIGEYEKRKGDITGAMRSGLERLQQTSGGRGIFGQDTERREDIEKVVEKLRKMFSGMDTEKTGRVLPMGGMVRKHGYPFEEHEVVTPDGYILLIHRIPHGRQQQMSGTMKRMPVFLQHGLLSSSDSWLLNEPEISLPYLLADAGFDVWMGNTRGNIYGRRHKTMTPTQPEFWNFSWDDIARHDVPTMVNYIVKLTDIPIESVFGRTTGGLTETQMLKNLLRQSGQNVGNVGGIPLSMRTGGFPSGMRTGGRTIMNPLGKLHYIGHSEGSLLGFVQFGRDKDLASKVGVFVALSPIGTMGVGQTPITNLMRSQDISKILSLPEVSPMGTMKVGQMPISSILNQVDISDMLTQPGVLTTKQILDILDDICESKLISEELCGRILTHLITSDAKNIHLTPFALAQLIRESICGTTTGTTDEMCQNILSSMVQQKTINPSYLRNVLRYPSGTSLKNLMHYSQLARTGNLQGFDYGTPELNVLHYKQHVPPQYKLTDVGVPVVLFHGKKDMMVSDKDYEFLRQNLPNIVHQDLIDKFGHLDFVVAKDAKDLVYDKIIKLLLTQQV